MIASSTTMPIARISDSRVRLLMVNPKKYINPNAATIEVGMARAGMIVAFKLRSAKKMMSTTRPAARSSVF